MFSSKLVILAVAACAYAIPAPQIISSAPSNSTSTANVTTSTSANFTFLTDTSTLASGTTIPSSALTTTFDSSPAASSLPHTRHGHHGGEYSVITITETVTAPDITCPGGPISSVISESSSVIDPTTISSLNSTGSGVPMTTNVVSNPTVTATDSAFTSFTISSSGVANATATATASSGSGSGSGSVDSSASSSGVATASA